MKKDNANLTTIGEMIPAGTIEKIQAEIKKAEDEKRSSRRRYYRR